MEEIIIDSVDVAGCNFRLEREEKQKCECCHATGFSVICDCENWHNCHYKQLKRLEQENAELKEELQKYKDMEAKGLEEFKDVGGCWGCGIQSASDQYFNDAKKYRHTLEEIREDLETQVYCECSECGNDDYGTCIECMTKRYIDKINEVLND